MKLIWKSLVKMLILILRRRTIKNSKTILELLKLKKMKTWSKNLNDVPAITGALWTGLLLPPLLVIFLHL